jgi:putative transposase
MPIKQLIGGAHAKVPPWAVSDAFWQRVEPLLPPPTRAPSKSYSRKKGGGRKPLDYRKVFEGIVYVLRTGCQWKALPKEVYGSSSSVHAYFRQWEKAGVFLAMWRAGLAEYGEMEGISWLWQSIDSAMTKAPLAQKAVGPNPTDRGKKGSKRHVLVEEHGVPLSIVVTGANRHDVTQLETVLDNIVIKRLEPTADKLQHLCADQGYDGKPAYQSIVDRKYIPRVGRRGEEIEAKKNCSRLPCTPINRRSLAFMA